MVWVCLTLNVRGPSYLGLTRSITWLFMPWLLTSPGHQQPWYRLCRICTSGSYLRKDFSLSTCVISMWSNDMKCKYMFMFPLENLARKGLMQLTIETRKHHHTLIVRPGSLFKSGFSDDNGPCENNVYFNSDLNDPVTTSLIETEWRMYASVNRPSLVQIMACRLVCTKPLSEPMLEYC